VALNLKMANAAVNAEADALSDQLDNGYLRIYDGSQPATADTAIGAQVLLAELRFNATASGAAVAGVLTFSAFTADASANASGTAAWFRALKSDGTTPVMDGSVGTATSDLILNAVAIAAGAEVSVTSWTHTVPKS
jgi:hypothetical protein